MQAGLEGEPLSDSMVGHFDACLGCMACVTACPSGVQYDRLIEATRAQVERRHRRPLRDRLLREAIFALFPYPRRLRAAARPAVGVPPQRPAARWCSAAGSSAGSRRTLAAMEALAPPVRPAPPLPERVAARGERRAVVGMLTGCVQREFFPRVNAATARVLAMEGCDVVIPRDQGCCGALSVHNGRESEAQTFARRTVDVFDAAGVEHVVVNAAGCGSAMKEYADLLADDPAYAERARRFAASVRDVVGAARRAGPGGRAAPAGRERRLPRRLPPRARAGRPRASRASCCGRSPVWSCARSPTRSCAAGRPASTTCSTPRPRGELGDRKARARPRHRRGAAGHRQPRLPHAGGLRRLADRAAAIGLAHTVEVLDASLRGRTPAQLARELSLPPTEPTGGTSAGARPAWHEVNG